METSCGVAAPLPMRLETISSPSEYTVAKFLWVQSRRKGRYGPASEEERNEALGNCYVIFIQLTEVLAESYFFYPDTIKQSYQHSYSN